MLASLFVLALFTLVGTSFLASYPSEARARDKVLGVVSQSSGVVLDGQPVSNPAIILRALASG
jgi:hypothetical protein